MSTTPLRCKKFTSESAFLPVPNISNCDPAENTQVSTTSPTMRACTTEVSGQVAGLGPTEGDEGILDRCEYELERDRRIAKIREFMKPMEQASQSLSVNLTYVLDLRCVCRG